MFRFSIRDVLWLTMLAAVVVAWWVDHRGQETRLSKLKADLHMSRAFDGIDVSP
jgi:hypothetical protein